VKPGVPSLSTRFSNWTTLTVAAPAARAALEKAYTWAPLKMLPNTPGSSLNGYSLVLT
jgi:hypothetical protein